MAAGLLIWRHLGDVRMHHHKLALMGALETGTGLADWPGLDCDGEEDDDVVDTALDHQSCQALDMST